jgi:enoyl-CoA hydratase/carnithine racemase
MISLRTPRDAGRILRQFERDGVAPGDPALVAVDLDQGTTAERLALGNFAHAANVLVGVARAPVLDGASRYFDLLLCDVGDAPGWARPSQGAAGALASVARVVAATPGPAVVFTQLLRMGSVLRSDAPGIRGGHEAIEALLNAESFAYGLLQAGPAFEGWLAARHRARPMAVEDSPPVVVERKGNDLVITLDRPEVHNAFSVAMRDALVDALQLVSADPTIVDVRLVGAGSSFCSGGDLNEFGTARDPVSAHMVRSSRHAARWMVKVGGRVTAEVHGTCVGAGVELAAFAHRVVADPDTTFRLPELAMGLIPGAGGTVSVPARVGPQRTAYLGLTGVALDAATAHEWGLVDEIARVPRV